MPAPNLDAGATPLLEGSVAGGEVGCFLHYYHHYLSSLLSLFIIIIIIIIVGGEVGLLYYSSQYSCFASKYSEIFGKILNV